MEFFVILGVTTKAFTVFKYEHSTLYLAAKRNYKISDDPYNFVTAITKFSFQYQSDVCDRRVFTERLTVNTIFIEKNICEIEEPNCDIFPTSESKNLTVRYKYVSNIDIALNGDLAALYSEYDVTNCIWPRQDYSPNPCNSKINFNLDCQYTFLVGTSYNDSIQLTPFSSCINAKILMRACDYNSSNKTYCNIINWIDFDERNGVATLNKSKIIAAESIVVGFQAQSYTFLDSYSFENIVTELQKVTFIFINKNTDIEAIDSFKYLISGEIKNITVSLKDHENDITFIKATSTSGINVFVSRTQQKNTYVIVCQGLSNVSSLENITLLYYDSYHSDSTFWNILTLETNVFVSNPPNFISDLNSITLQMCSKYIYKLPDVFDPENNNFFINVIGNNSYWVTIVTLNSSRYNISIDTSLLGLLDEDTKYTIEIKLEDTTEAYIIYYWNITVLHYSIPYFDLIPNVEIMNLKNENIYYRINTYFNLFQDDYKIHAEECYTENIIPWITNNPTSNSTSMITNVSTTNIGDYCAKLVVYFTCKNIIRFESNLFKVKVSHSINHPPIQTNAISNIIMYYGQQSKLVELPNDLFTDPDGDKLEYSSTNCIQPNSLHIVTTISFKKVNNLFLLAKKSIAGKCQISIFATDPYDSSGLLSVNVTIESCASKDCIRCDGNLQSNCQECISGYRLDHNTGACLEIFEYQSTVLDSRFNILGFTTFLFILVPILLSCFYGKITLYPIMYIQIIIILLFSDSKASRDIRDYFEWMQIYKLDFRFLNNIFNIQNNEICYISDSEKLKAIHLYCRGFTVNFIYLILMLIVLVLVKIILSHTEKTCDHIWIIRLLNSAFKSVISRKNVWWYLQNLLSIFPLLCIVTDIIDLNVIFINAFVSSIIIGTISIVVLSTRFECLSYILVTPNYIYNKNIYAYLHILRVIALICLFCVKTSSGYLFINIFFWCSQFSITIYIILLLMQFYSKEFFIMAIYNISILVHIPIFYLPISTEFQSSVDTIFCFFSSLSVFISSAVILCPSIQMIKICCKLKIAKTQNQI